MIVFFCSQMPSVGVTPPCFPSMSQRGTTASDVRSICDCLIATFANASARTVPSALAIERAASFTPHCVHSIGSKPHALSQPRILARHLVSSFRRTERCHQVVSVPGIGRCQPEYQKQLGTNRAGACQVNVVIPDATWSIKMNMDRRDLWS